MVGGVRRCLKVFLCHASGDKPPVREFYKRLVSEGVDAWLDKEKLLPGQDWRVEIPRAVEEADVVIVFLSKNSVTREGYVQKEIKFALDIAEEKPEGTIFLIPARIEECSVPERLSRWQWVDLYEEDGYAKLLRSLKLRADRVGAVIECASYVDTDKDRERRLDQWYTEGLAAFYTEEWEKACQRFRAILSEQPNYPGAREKLEEAERQRTLSDLYIRSLDAHKAENWPMAIKLLEELLQKSSEYKDAGQLLRSSKKQKQLKGLYGEARALHASQKWQAVLKVFEQISSIEPAYPDPENLLATARKEVAELNRLAELNSSYSQAVREMDAGQWVAARTLLERIHKSQTSFLETERLLRKAENEIGKIEEEQARNDQVNTLYEQAYGLMRAKKWRKAVEKIEEIKRLDEQFIDKNEILNKAKLELEREEGETQRQNELAAMYAEAVRLLKEGKYQEALDKWLEVKRIDPKYPDRQWVQRTARKELIKSAKPISAKARFVMPKLLWIGLGGIAVLAVLIYAIDLFGNSKDNPSLTSTVVPTTAREITTPVPATTSNPQKTSTPRLATSTSATSGHADPTMYDDFDNPANGNFSTLLWDPWQGNYANILKTNGKLSFAVNGINHVRMTLKKDNNILIREPFFFEAQLFLDPKTTASGTHFFISMETANGGFICGLFSVSVKKQDIKCWTGYLLEGASKDAALSMDGITPGWHTIRFEVEPTTMTVSYIIDGQKRDEYTTDHSNELRNSAFWFQIGMNNFGTEPHPIGYFDNVRIGSIADDPTLYDNFNNTAYDGKFDTTQWAYDRHDPNGSAIQQDGVLVFTQGGVEKGQTLRANNYWPLKLNSSMAFEANLDSEMTSSGIVALELNGDNIHAACGLHSMSDVVMAHCWNRTPDIFAVPVAHRTWHTVRIEVNVENNIITFFMDGKKLTEDRYEQSLLGASVYLNINVSAGPYRAENTRPMVGYVDNVRVLPLEYIEP